MSKSTTKIIKKFLLNLLSQSHEKDPKDTPEVDDIKFAKKFRTEFRKLKKRYNALPKNNKSIITKTEREAYRAKHGSDIKVNKPQVRAYMAGKKSEQQQQIAQALSYLQQQAN